MENFRGFPSGSEVIPLGKMTLIFGPNSGGKSTILKALGSFPQSLSENRNRVDISSFSWLPTGPWFDLGARGSVIHKGHEDNDSTEFSIGFVVESSELGAEELDFHQSDTQETTVDSDGRIVITYDIPEHIEYDRKKIALARPMAFRNQGSFLLIEGLGDGGNEVLLQSMKSILLPRYHKRAEGITSVKFRKKGQKIQLTINGPKEILREFVPRETNRGYRHPPICMVMVDHSTVTEKIVYGFDFGKEEHRATLSSLHLEREDSGSFSKVMGMEITESGDSFDLVLPDGKEADAYSDFLDANVGLLDRSELIPLIIRCKTLQQDVDVGIFREKQGEFQTGHRRPQSLPRKARRSPAPGRLAKLLEGAGRDLDEEEFAEWCADLERSPNHFLISILQALVTNELRYTSAGTVAEDRKKLTKQFVEEQEKYLGLSQILHAGTPSDEPATQHKAHEAHLQRKKVERNLNQIQQQLTDIQNSLKNAFENHPDESSKILHRMIKLTKKQSETILLVPPEDSRASHFRGTSLFNLVTRLWFSHRKRPIPRMSSLEQSGFAVKSVRHWYLEALPSESDDLRRSLKILSDLSIEVSEFTNSLDYLGATRLSPKRIYSFSSWDLGRVGESGSKSISSLAAKMIGKSKEARRNVEKFNSYLRRVVNLEANFKKIKVSGSVVDPNLVTVQISPPGRDGPGLALPDVGFGVSQCIPLLGATLTSAPLLCEEAESNLHPAAQARLMDCLLESIAEKMTTSEEDMFGPAMLLETHSEHFLKSLRNHLRRGEGLTDDDVVILYVDSDDKTGETVARRVMTKKGDFLQPWPRDRWDDETDPTI